MLYRIHLIPDLVFLVVSVAVQLHISYWALVNPAWQSKPRWLLLFFLNVFSITLLLGSYLLGFQRTWHHIPSAWGQWVEAVGLVLSLGLMGLYLGILLWRAAPKDRPARRRFLQGAATSLAVAPYVATAIGIICRDRFTVHEVNVYIPNLPPDLDGIMLV